MSCSSSQLIHEDARKMLPHRTLDARFISFWWVQCRMYRSRLGTPLNSASPNRYLARHFLFAVFFLFCVAKCVCQRPMPIFGTRIGPTFCIRSASTQLFPFIRWFSQSRASRNVRNRKQWMDLPTFICNACIRAFVKWIVRIVIMHAAEFSLWGACDDSTA